MESNTKIIVIIFLILILWPMIFGYSRHIKKIVINKKKLSSYRLLIIPTILIFTVSIYLTLKSYGYNIQVMYLFLILIILYSSLPTESKQ